ncbi:unnamed protein product [Microthlaspi erraticum]|uniref:Uncharacterized protein n=1 Tax=Microthlaspi erraticum TaxID=1685480 RepID=A0A6D2IAH4_9BRAS|nr:unnamed protein product [Microthlaspi erraticum]
MISSGSISTVFLRTSSDIIEAIAAEERLTYNCGNNIQDINISQTKKIHSFIDGTITCLCTTLSRCPLGHMDVPFKMLDCRHVLLLNMKKLAWIHQPEKKDTKDFNKYWT